jgi:Uma2 family endonuclease
MASAARREEDEQARPITMAEFMAMPEEPDGSLVEVVRGRLVREPPPAPLHGRVQAMLAHSLLRWTERTHAGVVLTHAGFALEHDPLTVRGPDVAFVSHARVPEAAYEGGYWQLAPDLAVEVLSPWNTKSGIAEKVQTYFAAGTRLVWVVDPRRRTITVHDEAGGTRLIEGHDQLDGGDVLPGLTIPLQSLFAF